MLAVVQHAADHTLCMVLVVHNQPLYEPLVYGLHCADHAYPVFDIACLRCHLGDIY